LIEQELQDNQLANTFNYQMPSYNNLINLNRFDTGLYTQKFQEVEFLVENYKNGSRTLVQQGFYSIRGQNLQVSQIGKSLYSNNYKSNFYQLFLPTNINKHGISDKIIYLGNHKKLFTLQNDDIIFGAEATFISFMPLKEKGKLITNIHGTILRHDTKDTNQKIFIKCMLDWFRKKGTLKAYSVGGNGGSFSTMYWDKLQFPLFPKDKQIEIAKLYYNPSDDYLEHIINLDVKTFSASDDEVNIKSGILDLDEQIKSIKSIIDNEIENMVK
jgi:type I restriction enzyme S subunit